MFKQAMDLLPILEGIETVKSSKLTAAQKSAVLSEIRRSVPSERACADCLETRAVILSLLGAPTNGQTKSTSKKVTTQTKDTPEQRKGGEVKLLRNSHANRGGTATKKRVVAKKETERRTAKGDT